MNSYEDIQFKCFFIDCRYFYVTYIVGLMKIGKIIKLLFRPRLHLLHSTLLLCIF